MTNQLEKLNERIIEETLQKARNSIRKRAIYCFHTSNNEIQRMVNAFLIDRYVQPHKHENPDKYDFCYILKGELAVVSFNDKNEISDSVILEEKGANKFVVVPPKVWHTSICLSNESVVYEMREGPYDPKTNKQFALWAPPEGSLEAKTYLESLKRQLSQISPLRFT